VPNAEARSAMLPGIRILCKACIVPLAPVPLRRWRVSARKSEASGKCVFVIARAGVSAPLPSTARCQRSR